MSFLSCSVVGEMVLSHAIRWLVTHTTDDAWALGVKLAARCDTAQRIKIRQMLESIQTGIRQAANGG